MTGPAETAAARRSASILVLADDLTGAADCGLQFTASGLRTRVFLDTAATAETSGCDAIVIDCESRALESDASRSAIETAMNGIALDGVRLFKKIDSTMRGNVGAEIDAMARKSGCRTVLVTPAYPSMGRTVAEGVLLVDGTPVDRTAIARDPATPVVESRIIDLISPQMPDVRIVPVLPDELGDVDRIRQWATAAAQAGTYLCLVIDARTDDDLQRAAALGGEMEGVAGPILWAGSAGIAEHLSKLWGGSAGAGPTDLPPARRPALLVCGSVNPVAIEQIDAACAAHGIEPVVMSAEALIDDALEVEAKRCADEVAAIYARSSKIAVLTTSHQSQQIRRVMELAAKKGLGRREASRLVANGLGRVAKLLLDAGTIGRLVATGGDTARATMEACGITAVDIRGTVLPGMPLVTAIGPLECHIVTKAGGFGHREALAEAMTYLIEGTVNP
ncbi:four-carbon acid sugar kinase family protein [Jiella avicenniae]|uniref:Four-carbon acid sugar kinase family protein n=1 Tax=Jiella avicenniae TaxID=2907202 RepID=A0A9X1P6Q8_9HYPH|nr:four-carbon acid sugar kinase family protein [Jiella avicenniae]MCE7030171.1 hypothetical protein [Jiella avicenniae]